jgi:hypothetical protein
MQTGNHASPTKGISKTTLQGSVVAARKTLRFQTRIRPEKRLSTKPLPVNHGRLDIVARLFHVMISAANLAHRKANRSRRIPSDRLR